MSWPRPPRNDKNPCRRLLSKGWRLAHRQGRFVGTCTPALWWEPAKFPTSPTGVQEPSGQARLLRKGSERQGLVVSLRAPTTPNFQTRHEVQRGLGLLGSLTTLVCLGMCPF